MRKENRDEPVELELHIHHETEKAYLLSDDEVKKNAKWAPKSNLDIQEQDGLNMVVSMPAWLAKKNGWV